MLIAASLLFLVLGNLFLLFFGREGEGRGRKGREGVGKGGKEWEGEGWSGKWTKRGRDGGGGSKYYLLIPISKLNQTTHRL